MRSLRIINNGCRVFGYAYGYTLQDWLHIDNVVDSGFLKIVFHATIEKGEQAIEAGTISLMR